jgi:transcriptional regulator with XRE-family HTH domain
MPKVIRELGLLGERIKLARLRRKLTCAQVSERAGITDICLIEIESGNPNITLGEYVKVLNVLNLEKDIYKIASDDILGRKLQDIELLTL